MSDVPDAHQRSQSGLTASLQWFVFGIVGITVLALAAVYVPARIKLLGLFPVGCGLIAGAGLGRLAKSFGISFSFPIALTTFVLIAAGQVGSVFEGHRQWAAKELEAFEESQNGQQALKDAKNKYTLHEFQTGLQATELNFNNFLARRVSPIGAWHDPWPLAFWISEVLLASAAGCWAFRRQVLPAREARQVRSAS